jgi:uncharacterized membrane protein YjgN (DUF898 family)
MAFGNCARCNTAISGFTLKCPACGAALSAILPRRMRDGTLCTHEGETSPYCTRCWAYLRDEPTRRALAGGRVPAAAAEDAHDGGGDAALDRSLTLRFDGDAREYFRIWAVNLCLTLLTLGIFSAWAKVRKKRYLYSHTTLGGTPFQYIGQPGPILRGRLIATALFLIYYSSTHFWPGLFPYVVILAAVLAPWVLVRSLAFNARYSAFRNMTFKFDGTYADAVQRLHGWGLIPALVVMLTFDWFGYPSLTAPFFLVGVLVFPFWQQRLRAFVVDHTGFGGQRARLALSRGAFFAAYAATGVRGVAGSVAVTVASMVFIKTPFPEVLQVGLGIVLVAASIYVGYVLVGCYLQARLANLVWNHTELGPLRFRSSLSAGGLAKLYVVNTLAILASLGLLIPWAVMRTVRYRVGELRIVLDGDLSVFHAEEGAPVVGAAGEELGALLDLDFSL